jgi:hypothetical protein
VAGDFLKEAKVRTFSYKPLLNGVMIAAMLLPVAALAQNETNHHADGRGDRTKDMPPKSQAGGNGVSTGNNINYNGGTVMHNGVNIYYIWYGNWAQDPGANAIITDFANNVGGSGYFNINTTYGDTIGNVQNSPSMVKYVTSASDSGSFGTSINDSNIWSIVTNSFSGGKLPVDPNGVYFVLTAPYVAETTGFLTQYCGWHSYGNYNGTAIKYAFVGNPIASLGACSGGASPNGDAAADAMVSVIAHELEESATDPLLNAWYDSAGNENADKCAWNFGPTYTTANGSFANEKMGLRDFLIQQNWVNSGGGFCAQSWATSTTPDFSLSVAPASQAILQGGTTGNYTVTMTPSNGYTGTLTYSVISGLPNGSTANVSANLISISTTVAVPTGTFALTIQGTDGTKTHTAPATLVINAPPTPDFSLSVSPASQTVVQGGTTGNYTLTATPLNGFSGAVTYAVVSGLPSGATANVSGNLINVSTTSTTPAGTYSLSIRGTSGSLTHSINVSLVVNAAAQPTFNLGALSGANVKRPSNGTATSSMTVTVSPVGGFTGTVSLTTSVPSTGVTWTLSNPTITGGSGSSQLTITVTSSAKKGNHSVTITGTSGSIVKTTTASFNVN